MFKGMHFFLVVCFLGFSTSCDDKTSSKSEPSFEIFVSNRGNNSVKRFDGDNGLFISNFVSSGSGGLNLTQEVAFGSDGHLYVSGRGNSSILKYDKTTGAFLGEFTKGYALDEPTKMTFGPDDKLYVSQWGKSKTKVARFDSKTGVFIDEITSGLNQGMSHAWDGDGNLYIVSFGSKDVKKYDAAGNFIKVFTSGGNLQGPVNLWFGSDGMLYVVDWETGSVQLFDGHTGVFVRTFISGLSRVEGHAFDRNGKLYLCDWVNNVINQYEAATGKFITTFISGHGISQPNSIAIRFK